MKIFGVGVLIASNTQRVIHDFKDGCFETVNPDVIRMALKQGFSLHPLPISEPVKQDKTEIKKDPNRIIKRRARRKK